MNNKINYKINNCTTSLETLIALDKRAVKDLENNTHEIEQEEILTIIREFIRLQNDYHQEKEKNKELKKEYERIRAGRNFLIEHISAQITTPELFDKLVEDNYISKDKIKEKIKELEKDMVLPETRNILQELLED